MANLKNKSADGTPNPTVEEIKQWYAKNKKDVELFAKNKDAIKNLRDVTKTTTRTIPTINKDTLKSYFQNIGSQEKNLRNVSRYLYYRSNVYFRLINWYADMWNLKCRIVTPEYSLTGDNNPEQFLKSFEETLNLLDTMNLQSNMTERFINVYVQDVSYALMFLDETGMFFYELDPDECIIDTRYSTGDFGFAIDMSKWKSAQRQKIIEFLGAPLDAMYREYESNTSVKYVHVPDEYASCFKFRTDTWDTCIPPFVSLFLELAGLEDLIDIQAAADALSVYKLIYMPLKVLSGAKNSDDFEVDPELAEEYFSRLLSAIPDDVAGALVPGDELKTIDFAKTVDSDTNSVEKSSNQILQTAGGGAVINANKITSSAAFAAWLKSETEFAISTLMPQVNGFTNRILRTNLSNPAKVEHFPISVYTQKEFAEQFMQANQYSYAYRLALGTLQNVSEKQTLSLLYLENDVLKLHERMVYPLMSSHTASGNNGEIGQGAPTKDDTELTDSGERDRNR